VGEVLRFFFGNFKDHLKNNFLFPQFYQTFIPYLNLLTLPIPNRQKKKKVNPERVWDMGWKKIVFYELVDSYGKCLTASFRANHLLIQL
jgi:hypothetical protein